MLGDVDIRLSMHMTAKSALGIILTKGNTAFPLFQRLGDGFLVGPNAGNDPKSRNYHTPRIHTCLALLFLGIAIRSTAAAERKHFSGLV